MIIKIKLKGKEKIIVIDDVQMVERDYIAGKLAIVPWPRTQNYETADIEWMRVEETPSV